MSFSDGAARLSGMAGWLLGWAPDAFWRATPAELACVLRAALGEAADSEGVDAGELARLMGAMPDAPDLRTG